MTATTKHPARFFGGPWHGQAFDLTIPYNGPYAVIKVEEHPGQYEQRRWHGEAVVYEWSDDAQTVADLTDNLVYLVRRLLQTDRDEQPGLFSDRLNDVGVALYELERRR